MSERSTQELLDEFEQATLDAKQMRLDRHTGSGYTTRADVDRANADRDAAHSALLSRIAELEKDAERLDWLEAFVNENRGITLHTGEHWESVSLGDFVGLGLRPGAMDRTLREAIDEARSASTEGK